MCFQSFIFGVEIFMFSYKMFGHFWFCVFLFHRYKQSQSKYWKFDVDHYVMEHHWLIVNYYITNIIETFKVMILHWPPFDDAPLPHPLFFMLKVKRFKNKK
jgi:hypothetical protein